MSVGLYLVGVAILAVTVAPLVLASVRLRARLVPAWTGAPARLAELVIVLALLLAVLHLLGAVGLFERWAVAAGGVVVGALVTLAAGRVRPVADDPRVLGGPDGGESQPGGAMDTATAAYPWWSLAGAGVLVAAVVGQWTAWVVTSVQQGVTDYDSLAYHLPQAVRFAQSGWVTRLAYTITEAPNMFHTADSELLHGLGMEVFQRDVLSPFLNLGWLVVLLLGAWCVGHPFRAGPLAVAVVAAVLASPLMAIQAGSALNDVSSAGMLVVAVALLVQPNAGRGSLALAGAAAGIGMSIKLTILAPAAALTLAVLVLVWRRGRWATWLWWLAPLAATGSFWYLRNLFRGDSPVPSLPLGVGPLPFAEPEYRKLDFGFSVLHYLTDTDVWRDFFLPGLDDGFGRAWPLVWLAALAGLVVALVRGGPRRRVAAVGGAAALVAYLATPASAFGPDGQPAFFLHNLRYSFGGLLVGLVLLCTARSLRRPAGQVAVLAGSAIVVVAAITSEGSGFQGLPDMHRRAGGLAAVLGLAVLGGVLLARQRRARIEEVLHDRRARPALAVAGALAALVVLVGTFAMFDRYLDRRYLGNSQREWVEQAAPLRIGLVGMDLSYLLYDRELGNRVQYVGDPGPHGEFHQFTACGPWRRALADGDYDVVVHWRSAVYPDHVWEDWTRIDPAATKIIEATNVVVYALTGDPDPATCPAA